jgi:hypothetical protein
MQKKRQSVCKRLPLRFESPVGLLIYLSPGARRKKLVLRLAAKAEYYNIMRILRNIMDIIQTYRREEYYPYRSEFS